MVGAGRQKHDDTKPEQDDDSTNDGSQDVKR
jgi:hypothetical protein